MNLQKAKAELEKLVRSSSLDGENVVFTKGFSGWIRFNEFGSEEFGECEVLDYLSTRFVSQYIIVNPTDFLEIRVDAFPQEKGMLRRIYRKSYSNSPPIGHYKVKGEAQKMNLLLLIINFFEFISTSPTGLGF